MVAQERARLSFGRAERAMPGPARPASVGAGAGRPGSASNSARDGQRLGACVPGEGAARTDGVLGARGREGQGSAPPMPGTIDTPEMRAAGPTPLDFPVAARVPARFPENHPGATGQHTLLFPARSAPSPFRRRPDHLLELRVIVDHETATLFHRAQDLLRHQIPDGNADRILRAALCALIEQAERRRRGAGGKQPPARAPRDNERLDRGSGPAHQPVVTGGAPPRLTARHCTQSRYIPVAVRRAVWDRDGARCAFRSDGGHRCTNRALLQFHHHDPFCRGGAHHVENLSLRCSAHNRYHAEQDLGPDQARARRAPRRHGARRERDARDLPDERYARDERNAQAPQDATGARDGRDGRDGRDVRDVRDVQDARDARQLRAPRDVREVRDVRDARDVRGVRDMPDDRNERDVRDARGTRRACGTLPGESRRPTGRSGTWMGRSRSP